jgi:iron complex outermembrane receptor protein
MNRKHLGLVSTAFIALMSSSAALSQTSQSPSEKTSSEKESNSNDEIIVTANRREQSLSKVPVSIAAYDQEQMAKQSVRAFEDIARLTPGLNFSRANRGNGNFVSIRGISSNTGASTVGIYIDETPVQARLQSLSTSQPYPRIFDLDRVEVLRGPQGTLFGAGSQGGTIRFVTPAPGLTEYSMHGRAELSSIKGGGTNYEGGAAVGGPIVEDKLGFRASAWYRRDGGYVDLVDWSDGHLISKNINSRSALVMQAALGWQASETIKITPAIFLQKSKIDDTSHYWEGYSNPSKGQFATGNRVPAPTNDRYYLPSLKIEAEIGNVLLTSNTSYLNRNNRSIFDLTTLGLATFIGVTTVQPPAALRNIYSFGSQSDDQRVWIQEMRIQNSDPDDRLNWVAGIFMQRSKQFSSQINQRPFILDEIAYRVGRPLTVEQFFTVPLYQNKYVLFSTSDTLDREISGYVNADFKLTPSLSIISGIRVSNNKYSNVNFGAGPVLRSLGSTTETKVSDTPITPKFGVSWQVDERNMLYATAAKGYRQGLTTAAVPVTCNGDLTALGLSGAPRSITPDTVWSYEVGTKNRIANGLLNVDASAYRIDWRNIQSSITLPSCNIPTLANLGEARSEGFDIQLTARPTDGLTLSTAIGYNNARFTTATTGTGGRVIRSKGEPLPTPPWTITLSGQYDFELGSAEGYARADYQYASFDDHPLDLASAATDPTIMRAPASNNLDLRIGARLENGVDVSLFANNMLDQHPAYARFRDTLVSFNYRAQTVAPRTVGVTVSFRQ